MCIILEQKKIIMSVTLKTMCEEWLHRSSQGPIELKTLVTRVLDNVTAENYNAVSRENCSAPPSRT